MNSLMVFTRNPEKDLDWLEDENREWVIEYLNSSVLEATRKQREADIRIIQSFAGDNNLGDFCRELVKAIKGTV